MSPQRTYRLGIDLGTTYTAAVICRGQNGAGWGEPEVVALGSQSASVASVLHLGADGGVLVGDAAERRSVTEPDRVVRQFKRRIGDDVPLVVGSTVHTAHELSARLARWVVDKVAEREGGPADAVAITHPAAWGHHKKTLLADALGAVGLTGVTFLPEPQAAAIAYSARERVDAGGAVAVYDLGGGTFDAAVVRRNAEGFELPGRAEGIEALGGVDFDDRVFDHVRDGIGAALEELDVEDPDVMAAVLRLRRECVEAKEALSFDTQATIPVMLPQVRTNVRLTRVEFEALIRESIDHTVDALGRSVESAGLTADQLQAVLLVGGSSRIPLVAQMISSELGRPVAVDSDPKTSIAVGAALAVAPRPAPVPARDATPRPAITGPTSRAAAPPYPGPAHPPPQQPVHPPAQPAATTSGAFDTRARQPTPGVASAIRHVPPGHGAPGAGAPVGPDGREAPYPGHDGHAHAEGRPATPSRPDGGYDGGYDEDDEDDGSRRTIIIVAVVIAVLIFAAAFSVGMYLQVSG